MLRKPQPKFQHFVKKIEAQARWFSYKEKTYLGFTVPVKKSDWVVSENLLALTNQDYIIS